jgi:hypothetical protein
MTDTATLQARLAEAEAAMHRLMIGERVRLANSDGQQIEYASYVSDGPRLRAYIDELKAQLGIGGRARARRVVFG